MSSEPSSHAVDEEILEAVFEHIDRGEVPNAEELVGRFPDRDKDVRAALRSAERYERAIQQEQLEHQVSEAQDVFSHGHEVGDYTITGQLGRGGMGVVYRARQNSLGGREVALKVLPPALVAKSPSFSSRFRREAELASTVEHEYLATVYASGADGGLLYFAMRLVEGRTLQGVLVSLAARRRLRETSLSGPTHIRRSVELVRRVALALGAIHSKGLVHRDVKPSNIVLECSGEDDLAALDCRPVLVDFGLLRPIEGSQITGPGTSLGTPAFASPESQLQRYVDSATDVFSLGAVLFDLLAQTTADERIAASAGLPDVRAMNPIVDERLAAVLRMAMEDSPSLRYENGSEFAWELERYLHGDPVSALPTGPLGRARLWMRRDPMRAIRTGALAATILVPTLVLLGMLGVNSAQLYALAKEAQRHEHEGDLVNAVEEYFRIVRSGGLAEYLPGMQVAVSRASLYWPVLSNSEARGAGLGSACRKIGSHSEPLEGSDRLSDGHLELLQVLQADEVLREPILKFLAQEIVGNSETAAARFDSKRRVTAAETAAHYLLLNPLTFSHGDGEAGEAEGPAYEPGLRELERALIGATGNGEATPLRTTAASALSGLGIEAFTCLVGVLAEVDPEESVDELELARVSFAASERLWRQLRADDALADVPRHTYIAWAEALHDLGRSSVLSMFYVDLGHLESTFCAAVLTKILLEEVGRDEAEAWSGLNPGVRPFFEAAEGALRTYRDGGVADRLSNGFGAFTCLTHPDPAERIRVFEKNWRAKESPYRHSNMISVSMAAQPTEHSAVLRPPQLNVPAGYVDHSAIDVWDEQVYFKDPVTSATARSLATGIQGEAAAYLAFNKVGASEFEVSCRAPEGEAWVRVTLDMAKAARWYFPDRGRARILVEQKGGGVLAQRDVPLTRSSIPFYVTEDELDDGEEFDFTIKFVGGTTTCWLYGVDVEFVPRNSR